MIRVLYVDHAEALGGAEHSLLLLLKHLDRERFQPLLACNHGPLAEAAAALDVPVFPVEMPRIRGEPLGPVRLLRGGLALSNIIRRQRVDIVHSNVMRASFYAALAAKLSGRPLVWHVRDIHRPSERWYTRLMCRLARRVIAISQAVEEIAQNHVRSRVFEQGAIVINQIGAVPFDDLIHQFRNIDGGGRAHQLENPFEGKSHAQPTNQYPRVLRSGRHPFQEIDTAQIRKHPFGPCQVRAH